MTYWLELFVSVQVCDWVTWHTYYQLLWEVSILTSTVSRLVLCLFCAGTILFLFLCIYGMVEHSAVFFLFRILFVCINDLVKPPALFFLFRILFLCIYGTEKHLAIFVQVRTAVAIWAFYTHINSRAGFLFLWRVVLKFDGDCTDSVNSFGNVTVFTLSVPPIFQGGSSPVLPQHLHFCSLVVWCFLCSGNFTSVLGLADYLIDCWGRSEWDSFLILFSAHSWSNYWLFFMLISCLITLLKVLIRSKSFEWNIWHFLSKILSPS